MKRIVLLSLIFVIAAAALWQRQMLVSLYTNYAEPGRAAALEVRLGKAGLEMGQPVFIRIFKQSSELELWVRDASSYRLFRTYEICRWSGRLGPKLREGDRQSPEGFYSVRRASLNPNSRHHLSFNLGFPNAFDRSLGRTGSFLMVHGGCSSIGCYAMTDAGVDDIYRLVEAALDAGQEAVAVHIFPFRMSAENLARHAGSQWIDFWNDLKPGYDAFEESGVPPRVHTGDGRYEFAMR